MVMRRVKMGFIEILSKMLKNFAAMVGETLALAILELQLVGKSLLIMILLILLSGLFLISFWLLSSVALVFWLVSLHLSIALAFFCIALLNLVLLITTLIFILKLKRRIQFPVISRQISSYGKYYEKVNFKTQKSTPEN